MGIQDKSVFRINLPIFSAVFAVMVVVLFAALVIESDARSGRKRLSHTTDTDVSTETPPPSSEQAGEEQTMPVDDTNPDDGPATQASEEDELSTEPVQEEVSEDEGAEMEDISPATLNAPEGEAGDAEPEPLEDEAQEEKSAGMGVNSTAAMNTPTGEGPVVLNTPVAEGVAVVNDVEHRPPAEPVDPAEMLQGMEAWELLGNNSMIDELYEVKTVKTEKVNGSEVRISIRQARYDEMTDIAIAPMTLVTISSNGLQVRQPLYYNRRAEFEYSIPVSRPQLLAIHERCGCEDPYADLLHLFTVYRKAIRPLGAVSGISDADGDGLLEPFVYDTAFSNGLGLIESERAPVVRVFLSVDKGRLVAERGKYESFYRSKIDGLSELIARDRAESPGSGDLAPVLEKFLYYKALGWEKEGWQDLEKDLMLYDVRRFPQQRGKGVSPEKFSVVEIVSRMRKALGKGWKGSNQS